MWHADCVSRAITMRHARTRGFFRQDAPEAADPTSGLRRVPACEQRPRRRPPPKEPSGLYELADLLEPIEPPPLPLPLLAPKRSHLALARRAALVTVAVVLAAGGWLVAFGLHGAQRAVETEPVPVLAPRAEPDAPSTAAAQTHRAEAAPHASLEPLVLEDVRIRARGDRHRASSRARDRAAGEAPEPSYDAPVPDVVAEPPVPSALPLAPTRADVVAALRPLEADVRRCAAGHYGVAPVRVAVHPSGRVTTATVTGGSVNGTAAGSCIARTLRRALFPRFSQPRFVVEYPFQL